MMASSSPRHELALLNYIHLAVGGEGLADVLRLGLDSAPGEVGSIELPCARLGFGLLDLGREEAGGPFIVAVAVLHGGLPVAGRLREVRLREPEPHQGFRYARVRVSARGDGRGRTMEGRAVAVASWAASVASAAWRSTASRAASDSASSAASWAWRSSNFVAAAFADSRAAAILASSAAAARREAAVAVASWAVRRFRRLALHGLVGGVRCRFFGGELGVEVLELRGGRLRCLASGGICSVRHRFCHGLR